MTSPDNNNDPELDVEFTPPSYLLKAKAPKTNRDLNTVLFEADNAVAALSQDYEKWVKDDLKKLEGAFKDLRASGGARDEIKTVHGISHDMLGQGGSFGYPLITTVGVSLCKLLKDRDALDEKSLEAAGVHVDSMRLIISLPLKGDGGAEGATLIKELEKVCAKLAV